MMAEEAVVDRRMSAREVFFAHNSLVCLAKALEKRYTTIDLINETTITGKINYVDGFMNITLSDVALYDDEGNYEFYELFFLQARNIRNIHIPTNINIKKAIKSFVTVDKKPVSQKVSTFKGRQRKKQQEETLKEIEQMKLKSKLV